MRTVLYLVLVVMLVNVSFGNEVKKDSTYEIRGNVVFKIINFKTIEKDSYLLGEDSVIKDKIVSICKCRPIDTLFGDINLINYLLSNGEFVVLNYDKNKSSHSDLPALTVDDYKLSTMIVEAYLGHSDTLQYKAFLPLPYAKYKRYDIYLKDSHVFCKTTEYYDYFWFRWMIGFVFIVLSYLLSFAAPSETKFNFLAMRLRIWKDWLYFSLSTLIIFVIVFVDVWWEFFFGNFYGILGYFDPIIFILVIPCFLFLYLLIRYGKIYAAADVIISKVNSLDVFNEAYIYDAAELFFDQTIFYCKSIDDHNSLFVGIYDNKQDLIVFGPCNTVELIRRNNDLIYVRNKEIAEDFYLYPDDFKCPAKKTAGTYERG